MALGGSASYLSIAASYFAKPQVVGVVGEDFQSHHMARMTDHGVDVRGIECVPGKTFHWRGRYHEDLNNRDTLETALNVFQHFNPTIPDAYRDTRYVMLGNIDPTLQLSVLDQTRHVRVVGMDTMNFWIDTAREPLLRVLERVDILFIGGSRRKNESRSHTAISGSRTRNVRSTSGLWRLSTPRVFPMSSPAHTPFTNTPASTGRRRISTCSSNPRP
jgi:hypothetical protein